MEAKLPSVIQDRAKALFDIFKKDPFDPRLRNERLYDSSKGSHKAESHSVQVTIRYRAIYVVDHGPDGRGEEQFCWYWIGSHEDYSNFIGCR